MDKGLNHSIDPKSECAISFSLPDEGSEQMIENALISKFDFIGVVIKINKHKSLTYKVVKHNLENSVNVVIPSFLFVNKLNVISIINCDGKMMYKSIIVSPNHDFRIYPKCYFLKFHPTVLTFEIDYKENHGVSSLAEQYFPTLHLGNFRENGENGGRAVSSNRIPFKLVTDIIFVTLEDLSPNTNHVFHKEQISLSTLPLVKNMSSDNFFTYLIPMKYIKKENFNLNGQYYIESSFLFNEYRKIISHTSNQQDKNKIKIFNPTYDSRNSLQVFNSGYYFIFPHGFIIS
jgi:hypothetical protein